MLDNKPYLDQYPFLSKLDRTRIEFIGAHLFKLPANAGLHVAIFDEALKYAAKGSSEPYSEERQFTRAFCSYIEDLAVWLYQNHRFPKLEIPPPPSRGDEFALRFANLFSCERGEAGLKCKANPYRSI